MTIAEALNWATQRLKKKKILSARLDAELLLGFILNFSRERIYSGLSESLTIKQLKAYKSLIKKRLNHFPLAYLTGKKEFMGLEFLVNRDVLIPRPETELLVETVIKISHWSSVIPSAGAQGDGSHQLFGQASGNRLPITDYRLPVIVDLGTGCGNIAVSLAKYIPDSTIYAVDNCRKTLELARRNAKLHKVKNQINFFCGNLFCALEKYELEGKIDVIVSNPPYVKSGDFSSLSPELQYEPRKALDGGKEGLKYYLKIIPQARKYLKPGGILVIEVGKGQSRKVVSLMKLAEYNFIRTCKDYAGINRVVVGKMGSTLLFGEKES